MGADEGAGSFEARRPGVPELCVSPLPPEVEDPEYWFSTNQVGIPPRLLGAASFNTSLRSLTIHGTREAHSGLFRLLDRCSSQEDAAQTFEHYMSLQFGLGPPAAEDGPAGRHRAATSYVELLRGWGNDSNSAMGAVLKGWVESRFGLVPVFHKDRLGAFPSPAWSTYLEEKTDSRLHDNCIFMQFDILFEFCQWSIRRFKVPGPRFVRLWRGTNDCLDQVVEGNPKQRNCVVRLNNLVSFSRSRERAEEFGDWVLETEVPTVKIVFFPGLLRDRVLNSEGEVLVIGGRYKVRAFHGYL